MEMYSEYSYFVENAQNNIKLSHRFNETDFYKYTNWSSAFNKLATAHFFPWNYFIFSKYLAMLRNCDS